MSAFARFHCVVAVVFGSVIVMGSEGTQSAFVRFQFPTASGSEQEEGRSTPSLLSGSIVSLLWSLQKGRGVGPEVEDYPGLTVLPQKSC